MLIPLRAALRSSNRSKGKYQQFVIYVPKHVRPAGTTERQPVSIKVQDVLAWPSAINSSVNDTDAEPKTGALVNHEATIIDSETAGRLLPDELIPLLNSISVNRRDTLELDQLTGEQIFLGRNCSANFFRSLASISISDLLPKNVSLSSAFALGNRTPLHFPGSLWTTVHDTIADVLKALPDANTCTR